MITALKQDGYNSVAKIRAAGFAKLAAELAPKIRGYGSTDPHVNALTTMLKRLTDADLAAK